MKAKQAQHHAEQALATQKQCDAHELALQGKLETASTAEALARKEAASILDVARQEASTILDDAKGRVAAAEREAKTIEGEVAALRAKCAAEASTHDARVAEARKVTAALEKDAEAWAGRAKASREECERAERDLSDLRDQNAAQSTALIKATDTAQADRAYSPVCRPPRHRRDAHWLISTQVAGRHARGGSSAFGLCGADAEGGRGGRFARI